MLEPLLNSLNNMRVILATTSIPRQELLRSTVKHTYMKLYFNFPVSIFL